MSMDNTPRPDGPQLAGATGSDIRSRPEQIIIPEPGSPRHAVDKPFWDIVIGLCCFVCGAPLGGGTWALRWESHRWAHLHCWEERCSSERALGDNPWLSEESAKRHGMTIGAFRELPNYERIRLNRESQEMRPNAAVSDGETPFAPRPGSEKSQQP